MARRHRQRCSAAPGRSPAGSSTANPTVLSAVPGSRCSARPSVSFPIARAGSLRTVCAGDYLLQVRALGYAVAAWPLQLGAGEVLHQDFELEPLPVQLDPVLVERQPRFAEQRRREFERRRSGGRGYFITEEQIRQASAHILSDLLRNVPGVHIQCRGAAAGCVVRMARAPRDSRPDYFVDAFPATYSTSLDMPTTGIIGVEIYRTLSETPLEFVRGNGQCGTIVIWTR